MPIGSTLFGVCNSAINSVAKTATLSAFDTLIHGVTIHIRFNNGNNVTSGLTLAVGGSSAYPITGNCVCNVNSVVEFTFDDSNIGSNFRLYQSSNICLNKRINKNNIDKIRSIKYRTKSFNIKQRYVPTILGFLEKNNSANSLNSTEK